MKKHIRIIAILLFLLITTGLISQTVSEKEIEKYIKTIDHLKKKNSLIKYAYPNMSGCGGGLDGYYYQGKLVYIDACYQAELGYSNRTMYLKDSVIYKIFYREHFAEWNNYYTKYPIDKYPFNASKMTYTDTLYTIILSSPISFIKTSNKKIINKNINYKLLEELLLCGKEMKNELESIVKWDGSLGSFIRIEIDHGIFYSIRLLKEGLLCKAADAKGDIKIDFYPLSKLNFRRIIDLQTFLLNNPDMFKDAVLNPPDTIWTSQIGLKFLLIKDNKSYRIDLNYGKPDNLRTCLNLLNNIIPEKKRENHKIVFPF